MDIIRQSIANAIEDVEHGDISIREFTDFVLEFYHYCHVYYFKTTPEDFYYEYLC